MGKDLGLIFPNCNPVEKNIHRRRTKPQESAAPPTRNDRPSPSLPELSVMPASHIVMPGLVPGISLHRFRRTAAWMPGTSPGMTEEPVEGAFKHDGKGADGRAVGAVRLRPMARLHGPLPPSRRSRVPACPRFREGRRLGSDSATPPGGREEWRRPAAPGLAAMPRPSSRSRLRRARSRPIPRIRARRRGGRDGGRAGRSSCRVRCGWARCRRSAR